MDIQELIKGAKLAGRRTLTEVESKEFLRAYGVPVVTESFASSPEEAVVQAEAFGYPVVLKGLGKKLTHKTERGLVHLSLQSRYDVLRAAQAVKTSAGDDLEGYLIQPMICGRREFVAGLFIDPQFGPIIMFGLGGIFTEALGDVTFRVAPVNEAQAARMLYEIHASAMLGPFRGEKRVLRDELIRTLVGLSRMGEEWPDIKEVDINPLVISADGRASAVDALIVLGEHPLAAAVRPSVAVEDIRQFFYPRSVAFVGASARPVKWGYTVFTNVLAGGYEGKIFLVNSKGEDIAGQKVYKNLADISERIDLGVVTIPARHIIPLLGQFKAKGIRYMLLITSGFGETGEVGRRLEQELVTAARDAGILILGPNTMGICNPHAGLYCMGTQCWPKAGSIGLVSQSGNLGTQLLAFAEKEGIGIRAFCGSGNETMITIEDYLHGFADDVLTKTVVLYIESIKNGRRFFETARRVSRKKPVIILKGGRTAEGSRAAASHTGALAGNIRIFDVACHQAGALVVEQPMDLLDLSAAFSSLPLPKGNRVALMTLGGGWGVVATDLCIKNGLEIPSLTADIIARIDEVLPPYWSRENPVDLVGEFNRSLPLKVLEALVMWEHSDAVIHLGIVGKSYIARNSIKAAKAVNPLFSKDYCDTVLREVEAVEQKILAHTARLMETYGKPILGVMLLEDEKSRTVTEIPGSDYKGIVFPTPERAVKALARMVEYENWRSYDAEAK